jgi:hypothetical protein
MPLARASSLDRFLCYRPSNVMVEIQMEGRMMERKYVMWLSAAAALVMVASGCNDEPVTPNIGADTKFSASANGTALNFAPSQLEAFYDTVSNQITINGLIPGDASTGTPSRMLTLKLNSDLASGSYPRTITEPNASMTYTLTSYNDTTSYVCQPSVGGTCSVTISSFEQPRRVSGSFSGTLPRLTDDIVVPLSGGPSARGDTVSSVSIAGGSFSLVLH